MSPSQFLPFSLAIDTVHTCIRQHTSACVRIREHTCAYVSIRMDSAHTVTAHESPFPVAPRGSACEVAAPEPAAAAACELAEPAAAAGGLRERFS
jgi:hypothetical protein